MTSNVDAIYAEYPFLEQIRPRVKTSGALVKRFEPTLLMVDTRPHYIFEYGRIQTLLLDENGVIVAQVGKLPWRETLMTFLETLGLPDETIGQAFTRIGERLQLVHYVITLGETIVLYRLPNGFANADAWRKALMREGLDELRQS